MTFEFRPAVRENVNLLIGLIGSTGSGKTYSAMRMASGIAQGKRFAVIDTEAGRAKHYAKHFAFDHGDLMPPFRPKTYLDAILAAEAAGYPVIVTDSTSHEHAGEGGLLEWHDEIQERMAKGNDAKREQVNLAAWIEPKREHKKFVGRLLQLRCHLILCFRAEEKVKPVKGPDGKTKIEPIGWQPICEKNMPYELTCSFLLESDAPGIGKPLKLEADHRPLFPPGELLDEKAGERILAWSKGGDATHESRGSGKGLSAGPDVTPGRVMVDDWKTLIRDADMDTLPDVWSGAVKACKKFNDNDAYQALLAAKEARKKELGL